MVHRIEAALFQSPKFSISIQHVLAQNVIKEDSIATLNQSGLIVSIGAESLDKLLSLNTKTPILSVLTRKAVFEQILRSHQRTLNDKNHPLKVVYLDQPLSRQLDFIQTLFKDKKQIHLGVLLGSYSIEEKESLQTLTQKNNIALTSVFVKKFENPVGILDSILSDVNVILAIPDPRIYHSSTARGMLLTAFHKQVPLIGFSHTFVNNGALGALYSNMKQIGDETAGNIIAIMRHGFSHIPNEQYPREYLVAINYQVAKSLGMDLPNQEAIKSKLSKEKA